VVRGAAGPPDGAWRRPLALAAGLILLFTAATYVRGAALDPTARDQAADMGAALRIREGGRFFDGSRSPLFPALLAPLASRSPDFFVRARLVSVALAACCALAVLAAAARVFGAGTGLFGAFVFLFEWRFQARRICPEPLVALLLVGATFLLAERERCRRPGLFALGAGALLGLAWMAKGSALLSLAACAGFLLVAGRRPRLPAALLLLTGFALTGAPLLVSSTRQFGSPLFNASSSHVMWEERWDQELDLRSTATARSYFAQHTPGEFAARLLHGLLHQKAVEWVYIYLALLLAARLRRRTAPSPAVRAWHRLVLLSVVCWLPPFAFYEPVVASRRFLFPVLAMLIPACADLLVRLLPVPFPAGAAAMLQRASGWLAGGAAAAAVLIVALHGNPYRERHFDESTLALARRLSLAEYRNARILARPSRTIPVEWLLPAGVQLRAIPYAVPDADAPDWIRENASFLLLNAGLLALRPSPFADYARWDETEGIVPAQLPPWLRIEYRDPAKPSRYLLLRIASAPSGRSGG